MTTLIYRLLLFVFLLCSTVSLCNAQWVTDTIGLSVYPAGIFYRAVNNQLFVSSTGFSDIFTSYNGGKSWLNYLVVSDSAKLLGDTRFGAMAFCPTDTNIIVAAPFDGLARLLRSTNSGKTWNVVKGFEQMGVNSESICFLDEAPNIVVAGINEWGFLSDTKSGYVIRSKDYGVTWDTVANLRKLFNMEFCCGMAVNSQTGNIFLGGDGGKIICSTDSGSTWQLVLEHDSGYVNNKVPIIRFSRNNFRLGYATFQAPDGGRPTGGIWRTTNAGASWSLVPEFANQSFWALDMMDVDDRVEVIASDYNNRYKDSRFWHSVDGGYTWKALPRIVVSLEIEEIEVIAVQSVKFMPRTPEYKDKLFYTTVRGMGLYHYNPQLVSTEEETTDGKEAGNIRCWYSNGTITVTTTDGTGVGDVRVYGMRGLSVAHSNVGTAVQGTIRTNDFSSGVYIVRTHTSTGRTLTLPVMVVE